MPENATAKPRDRCSMTIRIKWKTGIRVFCSLSPHRTCVISLSRPRGVRFAATLGMQAAILHSATPAADGLTPGC